MMRSCTWLIEMVGKCHFLRTGGLEFVRGWTNFFRLLKKADEESATSKL